MAVTITKTYSVCIEGITDDPDGLWTPEDLLRYTLEAQRCGVGGAAVETATGDSFGRDGRLSGPLLCSGEIPTPLTATIPAQRQDDSTALLDSLQ